MARKNINTTLDENLYKQIKLLAINKNVKANDLIEEGMKYILKKYEKNNECSNIKKIENIDGDVYE